MIRALGQYRDAITFLGARMVFFDGMSAMLIYSGIYAIGIMKWEALDMFAYGLIERTR